MKKRPIKLCAISILFFTLLIWTIWGNTALTVNNIKISSSRIPATFSGFRIAQVSDLHNAQFGKGNKKLLELLSESKPDIIAITGDLVDAGHTNIGVALDFAKEAVNIAPVYYVTGNHEASLSQYNELKTGLETILLSHRPELFESYARCNIDLVLSGHAHGGQFRLPFIGGLIAPNQGLFPKYDAGLFTNGSTMIICSGGLRRSTTSAMRKPYPK